MSDHTQSLEIAGRLQESVETLQGLIEDVAAARQVKEFSSERRKSLLAVYMQDYANHPTNRAETLARQSEGYLMELEIQEKQYRKSEEVIAKWNVTMVKFDAARSLMAQSREIMRHLDG